MFGSSKTLQLRNQKKNKSKDDGLLKRYGRVEKTDQQQKQRNNKGSKRKKQRNLNKKFKKIIEFELLYT